MDQQHLHQTEKMHFLLFSASLRKDSLNTRLIKLAAHIIEKNNGNVDIASMSEFDCPSFNQDVEANGAIPTGANESGNDFWQTMHSLFLLLNIMVRCRVF